MFAAQFTGSARKGAGGMGWGVRESGHLCHQEGTILTLVPAFALTSPEVLK